MKNEITPKKPVKKSTILKGLLLSLLVGLLIYFLYPLISKDADAQFLFSFFLGGGCFILFLFLIQPKKYEKDFAHIFINKMNKKFGPHNFDSPQYFSNLRNPLSPINISHKRNKQSH